MNTVGDGTQKSDQLRVKIVAGSFVRKVENVFLYTSISPLIYKSQFKFSKIIPVDLNGGKCEVSLTHCFLLKKSHIFIEAIENRLGLIESVKISLFHTDFLRLRRNVVIDSIRDGLGSAFSFCCSLVTNADMDSIFTTQSYVKEHLGKMKDSIITDHSNILVMENFTSDVQAALDHYQYTTNSDSNCTKEKRGLDSEKSPIKTGCQSTPIRFCSQ
ncbi:hypothetical protein Fcan01_21951 [Folsomia candida]|uniref:Uncharacterized protein n=1 Tax=Folsomia candida TaxID=158441 RepID=A0A226DF89_FOLCA|nr:hypothetical protein Fcan01_21951 [Folsomia candida]